ncbi:DUF4097 family beta strand repeat-containing protein [Candidatus Chlorohelix sp.]|uniref:DUF4097 family beta strand repeat-containing protein n=1 Tax=Candidatus Chlorohelix sp. TaxID=3139201 RepID=UPI00303DC7CA
MNPKMTIKWLVVALAMEIGIAAILLIITGHWLTLLNFVSNIAILGGLGYWGIKSGIFNSNNYNRTYQRPYRQRGVQGNTMQVTIPGVKFNWGGMEQTEAVNLEFEVNSQLNSIQLDVQVGNVKVIGKPGLEKITVNGYKRVWIKDPLQGRSEFENLQVSGMQENGILRIYAGTREKINVALGQVSRVDLEITVPENIPGVYNVQSGELSLRNIQAELSARSNLGNLYVENFSSGKNLNVTSQSGSITLQQIAAGQVHATTNLGKVELTGGGAEMLYLESSAGNVRARGVNCGIYKARTNAGSVEVYDLNSDGVIELRTNVGRVYANNVTAPGFQLTTDAGSVFYQGSTPTINSEAHSNLGSVQLRIAPGSSFALEASSNVGTVSVGLPISNVYMQNKNNFRGIIGAGGAMIQAGSNLGSVQISN